MAQPREPEHAGARDLRPVLLYDRDCGFCRWSLARVRAWDRRGRLRALALQDPEADHLLVQIDEGRRMDSWHLSLPGGEIRSGGRAIAPLLFMLPGGRPLSRIARTFPRLTDAAYTFVARHRSRLGRMVAKRDGG